MRYIIMDLDNEITLVNSETNEIALVLPRYGVYEVYGNRMEDCVDTGNDLEMLKEKYNTDVVVRVKDGKLDEV